MAFPKKPKAGIPFPGPATTSGKAYGNGVGAGTGFPFPGPNTTPPVTNSKPGNESFGGKESKKKPW